MNYSSASEPRLEQALEKLSHLHPKKIDLSLDRIGCLLKSLGNPETKLPPVIHIAGTNGKGSVAAFIRSILEAAGLKVHVYTSPHLVSFRERIRVAGKLIEETNLLEILDLCEQANGEAPVTFFEITTAAALQAFASTKADVCILEVGLGGRLDATNVINKPLCSIVTPVGLDHAEFLGTDLKGVAAEKAAIAKKATPLLIAHQAPEAYEVIAKTAADAGAVCFAEERDWRVQFDTNGPVFNGFGKTIALGAISLDGPHQAQNAGVAVACLLAQNRFRIAENVINKGLKNAQWPARFQRLSPASFKLPDNATVWLDGGHNPMAGRALARVLDIKKDGRCPLYIIAGMLTGKDAEGFLGPLVPFADALFAVPVPGSDAGRAPEELCKIAKGLGLKTEPATSARDAITKIPKGDPPQVLITGSLYLAGSVLRDIGWQPK